MCYLTSYLNASSYLPDDCFILHIQIEFRFSVLNISMHLCTSISSWDVRYYYKGMQPSCVSVVSSMWSTWLPSLVLLEAADPRHDPTPCGCSSHWFWYSSVVAYVHSVNLPIRMGTIAYSFLLIYGLWSELWILDIFKNLIFLQMHSAAFLSLQICISCICRAYQLHGMLWNIIYTEFWHLLMLIYDWFFSLVTTKLKEEILSNSVQHSEMRTFW